MSIELYVLLRYNHLIDKLVIRYSLQEIAD